MGKQVITRNCLHCGKIYTVHTSDNIKIASKIHYFCAECTQILSTTEKKRIKREKVEGYHEKQKQQRKASWLRNYKQSMITKARQRAKKYNFEFNLSVDDIDIPEICPILEVPLQIGTKGDYEYSPSLDRIDNTKGYIKGNVRVISKKANSMKNSATMDELKTFCKNILRYSLNNEEYELIEQEDKEPLG